MSRQYSDHERQKIANEEYTKYSETESMEIINDKGEIEDIGTVRQVIENETGIKVYVVESPDHSEVSVLYEGSKAPFDEGWEVDWFENDIPMAHSILTGEKGTTSQLKASADILNDVLVSYPNAKVTVYGHSLGSMNAQYALANVRDISRISGAYIYQGPNTYPVLTEEQRQRVDAMKYRIHNYVDDKDMIPIGYPKNRMDSVGVVGIMHHVDSKQQIDFIYSQHLWGGYVFNEDVKAKETLASGGYTSNEEIFLDSEHALTISSGLHEVANAGHEEIRSIVRKAHQKAEKIVASTYQVPFGFILSPTEVATAYSDGGVSRTTILDDLDHYFYPKIKKSEKLAEDFQSLEKQIADGVQKKLEDDKELAGNFKEWMKIK